MSAAAFPGLFGLTLAIVAGVSRIVLHIQTRKETR